MQHGGAARREAPASTMSIKVGIIGAGGNTTALHIPVSALAAASAAAWS